ncbi:class I SAM-dependent methyltransferase [Halorubellus sp. PRR65]|uniref:class I SAM-dependent methyltransferase n=1 Tax=Halorubellus sp. PRR65 TaxID=3098148 RepID=UPI002B25F00D|nr:class I SAM-dependent methyltransferase [Halorubellus sp. PRR65]
MPADDDPIARDAYDELADSYAVDVRENAYNAHIEFPATSAMIPDVAGKRVLDAGCGTGAYSAWLVDQDAAVVGVDVSEAMLAHARDAVPADAPAEFVQADLGDPLSFPADAFDGVVSALALGYVRDWDHVFAEFRRVLRDGGFLVFSTAHPLDQFGADAPDAEDYFAVERLSKDWAVEVPYYRRPFGELVRPLLANGFRLDDVVEPQPTEAFREQRPERYEKESTHPVFLCVRATAE